MNTISPPKFRTCAVIGAILLCTCLAVSRGSVDWCIDSTLDDELTEAETETVRQEHRLADLNNWDEKSGSLCWDEWKQIVALIQTQITLPGATKEQALLARDTKMTRVQAKGGVGHRSQLVFGWVLFLLSALIGVCCHFSCRTSAAEAWKLSIGGVTGRVVRQVSALSWKNAKVSVRTEMPCRFCCPCCLNLAGIVCNGFCLQVSVPVVYILLLTLVPTVLTNALVNESDLAKVHETQYWLNYSAPETWMTLRRHPLDYLFQEPKQSELARLGSLGIAPDPQPLWRPQGSLPAGACFCRTLGVVGPRAGDFVQHMQEAYLQWATEVGAGWVQGGPGDLTTMQLMEAACPGTEKRTLFRTFSNEKEVVRWLGDIDYGMARSEGNSSNSMLDQLCGVVVFDNDPFTEAKPSISIRTNISGLQIVGSAANKWIEPRQEGLQAEPLTFYVSSGFLAIQDLVQSFIAHGRLEGEISLPRSTFVDLPAIPSDADPLREALGDALSVPTLGAITFAPTVILITYFLIHERRSKQKELMRLMGLYDSSLSLSWLLLFALINLFTMLCASLLIYGYIVKNSDFVLLFLIFFLTSMAATAEGMAMSTVFSNERIGATVAVGLFFITGLSYFALVQSGSQQSVESTASVDAINLSTATYAEFLLISIFPNVACALSFKTYLDWDKLTESGSTWQNIFQMQNKYTVAGGLGMLLLDILLWGLIYVYLDQVVQHEVGTAKHPLFFLMPSYWRGNGGSTVGSPLLGESTGVAASTVREVTSAPPQSRRLFEEETGEYLQSLRNQNRVVAVVDLRKEFTNAAGARVNAVDGVSLTMYEGECFCLLGHNGAGKTTTMSMITGTIPPTSGDIQVLGKRLPKDITEVRSNLGFCMQQNILWDTLTVEEHLHLFGSLMDRRLENVEESCGRALEKVSLESKRHEQARHLSGGMKRKLNVAVALLGDARVVILDEPTAGMDPYTRRILWEVIKQERRERIICLTTHHMDEADELGDRVAIMADGRVACQGTNNFLKKQLGCGYLLTIVKRSDATPNGPIQKLVENHCGAHSARDLMTVGKEIRFSIAFDAAAAFPALLKELDVQPEKFGVDSYGISVCDLEDVFLKVGKNILEEGNPQEQVVMEKVPRMPVAPLAPTFRRQFMGMLQRRLRYGIRDRRLLCCQLVIPLLVLLCFMFLRVRGVKTPEYEKVRMDTAGWIASLGSSGNETVVSVVDRTADGRIGAIWLTNPPKHVTAVTLDLSSLGASRPPSATNARELNHELAQQLLVEQAVVDASLQLAASGKDQFGSLLYSGDTVTLCPNASAFHSAPTLSNLHFTEIMKASKQSSGTTFVEAILSSQPLPVTARESMLVAEVGGMATAAVVLMAYAFVPAGICSFYVMEKETQVNHQFQVSGVGRLAYWLADLAFDTGFGVLFAALTFVVLLIYAADDFCQSPQVKATVVLLLLFAPAAASQALFASKFFNNAGGALVSVLLMNLILGSMGLAIGGALQFFDSTRTAGTAVLWVAEYLVPPCCIGHGLVQLAQYKVLGSNFGVSVFSGRVFGGRMCHLAALPSGICAEGAGDDIFILITQCVLFSTLAWLMEVAREKHLFERFIHQTPQKCPDQLKREEDQFVHAERRRVQGLDPSQEVVVVDDVYKVYEGNKHAVRGVSYAVEGGQTFGLLGANGAGKTTSFQMLCGQTTPSYGRVFVAGKDVASSLAEIRSLVGYCPQFNALLDLLTVREHLELYATIKGMDSSALEEEVIDKMETFDLGKFENTRACQLSGGNMRKLSTAIAVVGEPRIVLLDEPSAGMDPVARRHMWSVIQLLSKTRTDSAVVLTTHAMDEAEALCTRIAIQCSGQLRCIGTPQQLKKAYGKGLELHLRFALPERLEVEARCASFGGKPEELCPPNTVAEIISAHAFSADGVTSHPLGIKAGEAALYGVLAEWSFFQERAADVEKFLKEKCKRGDASCTECSGSSLRYRLADACPGRSPLSFGELYGLISDNQKALYVHDFHLGQGTLEKAFNALAAEDLEKSEEEHLQQQGDDDA